MIRGKKFTSLEWIEEWQKLRSQPNWAGGRRAHRHGEVFYKNVIVDLKPRITLSGRKEKPLLSKAKREHLIGKVFEAMSDWRYSPFQYEAQARYWLRQTFCLQGYDWHRSDAEAAFIVSEALKGWPRPSYPEGQRNYTIGDDFCAGCGGRLDDADIANRVRYCCDECRKITQFRSARLSRGDVTVLAPVKCANPECQRTFFPRNFLHVCCSHECSHAHKAATLPLRKCEKCWKPYQPTHEKSLYCGAVCRGRAAGKKKREATAASRPMLTCAWCGEPFRQGKHNSRFCSEKHQKAASRVRERAAKAAKEAAASDHPIQKLFDDAA